MRIAKALLRVLVIGAGLLARAGARASTAARPTDAMAAAPPMTAMDAFRSGAHWLKAGDTAKAVHSLEYAAEKGHALAQWKLGRMYAEGDGVAQDDLKAFDYFRRIADSHADDNPDTPQARFVANAFVALGHYYLDGIPKTAIKRDPDRAREMFAYAASYFRDPDAQYYLARLYLDGTGAPHDPRQAARWFGLSAQKGQCQAQAMLGAMLFAGDHVPRQAARGLMWLTLAKDNARTRAPIRPGSASSTTAPSSRRPRTSARWRCVYLKRWLDDARARVRARSAAFVALTRLDIQIDIDRHVVGRLVPAAHVAVDAGVDQPVGGLRRQQQVVDADAVVLLARRRPGSPRTCRGRRSSLTARMASVRPRLISARNLSRVCGRNSASLTQASGRGRRRRPG